MTMDRAPKTMNITINASMFSPSSQVCENTRTRSACGERVGGWVYVRDGGPAARVRGWVGGWVSSPLNQEPAVVRR